VVARTCGHCRGTGEIIRTPCASCRGTGLVTKERRVTARIPAGIADGQRLRLHGEGEHGSAGGPTGDLYVVIHVRAHDAFHREGDDLYIETQVPFPLMAMGGSFKVDGPAGEIEVDVPAGCASGSLIPFRGKGMPSVNGRGKGTLFVRVVVQVPRKISKEQRKLIEQLGQTMKTEKIAATATGDAGDRPFFEKVKDLFG
jgi:molecular chaperone DnaJ